MIKTLKYLKTKEWVFLILSIGLIVAQVYLELKIPEYMSEITSLVQNETATTGKVIEIGLTMLGFTLLSVFSAVIVGYFMAMIGATVARSLRKVTFEKTMNFSNQEINQFQTSSLITRSTNDINQVQMVIAMGVQLLIKAPIMALWAILKIKNINWQWTLTTFIAVAILIIMLVIIMILALPRFKKMQTLTDQLNRSSRENLTGLKVIKAFNAESYQQEKFTQDNQTLTKNNLFTMRIMAIMQPMMTLIMSGISLAIYAIGASLIQNTASITGRIDIFSNMVVFSSYAVQIIISFMMLSMLFIILPRAQVSAKRIFEVINTKSSIVDGPIQHNDNGLKGTIEFNDVSFKYQDGSSPVLSHISFQAKQGQTVAFIGPTGSGKSTIANLMMRFYDVSDGEIKIDGINIKEYNLNYLRNKMGYVSQRAILFSGNIKDNVAYKENEKTNVNDAIVSRALSLAQSNFVLSLDNNIYAPVSQGGKNFSGGQKQRLTIARALYDEPEILIFDDSFSALDYKTDLNLRQSLQDEVKNATKVIIAQRIGTIKQADLIIVLENGEIVGQGTHETLLKTCKTYLEIALSQLSKEELNYE